MKRSLSALSLAMLAGCATLPDGPRVAVMPAPNKPFEVFVAEDHLCRNFAAQSIGATPNEAANRNVAGGAVAGTAIGAAAGALGGGQHGAGAGAASYFLLPVHFLSLQRIDVCPTRNFQ